MQINPSIVMCVSDDLDFKRLKFAFLKENYLYIVAKTGQEVLDKVAGKHIDLVILDELTTGPDALNVIISLKGERHAGMPVALLISSEDGEIRKKAVEFGCDDFILKPVEEDELMTKVYLLLQIGKNREYLNQKELLGYILNNILECGIIITDKNHNITTVNRGAVGLLGIDHGNWSGDLIGYIENNYVIKYDGDLKTDVLKKPLSFDIARKPVEADDRLILKVRFSGIRNPMGELINYVFLIRRE